MKRKKDSIKKNPKKEKCYELERYFGYKFKNNWRKEKSQPELKPKSGSS